MPMTKRSQSVTRPVRVGVLAAALLVLQVPVTPAADCDLPYAPYVGAIASAPNGVMITLHDCEGLRIQSRGEDLLARWTTPLLQSDLRETSSSIQDVGNVTGDAAPDVIVGFYRPDLRRGVAKEVTTMAGGWHLVDGATGAVVWSWKSALTPSLSSVEFHRSQGGTQLVLVTEHVDDRTGERIMTRIAAIRADDGSPASLPRLIEGTAQAYVQDATQNDEPDVIVVRNLPLDRTLISMDGDGRCRWARPVAGRVATVVPQDFALGGLTLLIVTEEGQQLLTLSPCTGEARWRSEVVGASLTLLSRGDLDDDGVADGLVAKARDEVDKWTSAEIVSGATGKTLGTLTLPDDAGIEGAVRWQDGGIGGLVLAQGNEWKLLDPAHSFAARWSRIRLAPELTLLPGVVSDDVLALEGTFADGSWSGALQSVRADDGAAQWSTSFELGGGFEFVPSDGNWYAATSPRGSETGDHLLRFERQSGTLTDIALL